jgi:hypothetical protein
MNDEDITDYKQWDDMIDDWGKKNPLRSRIAGDLIPNGSTILDIGAGSIESFGCMQQSVVTMLI